MPQAFEIAKAREKRDLVLAAVIALIAVGVSWLMFRYAPALWLQARPNPMVIGVITCLHLALKPSTRYSLIWANLIGLAMSGVSAFHQLEATFAQRAALTGYYFACTLPVTVAILAVQKWGATRDKPKAP